MKRRTEAVVDEQAGVRTFLADPASYAGNLKSVQTIETHGAIVFLAGNEVWKIKRAVHFPYMDLSTQDKRREVCRREVEINAIWAPQLYLGCVPVTREADGQLALGGKGEPVEWAVHMRRFAQQDLLGNIADRKGISDELARDLADVAVDSHAKAPVVDDPEGAARIARLVASLSSNLAGVSGIVGEEEATVFRTRAEAQLARAAAVLDERARQGLVRRCHGDFHLGNIVLWEGKPLPFDAIEFDEDLASIDLLYDLAFLLMDLDHRGIRAAANVVLNRYLWRSQRLLDLDGLAALPLFLGLRAGVRALVAAERAEQESSTGQREAVGASTAKALGYMRAALDALDTPPPELVAIGGLSGTGKSTLAAALAPRMGSSPGAVHLRSDLERKALFGRAETERLGPECYTDAATERVYGILLEKARRALAAGHGVILDAVFARPEERRRLERLAESADVQLKALWLTAEPETLMERVARRRNDASDATVDVVRKQLGYDLGAFSSSWKVLDTGRDGQTAVRRAEAALSG